MHITNRSIHDKFKKSAEEKNTLQRVRFLGRRGGAMKVLENEWTYFKNKRNNRLPDFGSVTSSEGLSNSK